MADEIVCKQGCGKEFTADGAWRVKHELKCKGKVQTRGRIDRLTARRGEAAQPTTVRRTERKPASLPQPIPATLITPAAMIAALRAEAEKIQNAIAAIEALG